MNLRHELETRLSAALVAAGAPDGSPALVLPAARPEFGDYQANGVMATAKKLKTNPRELAGKMVAAAQLDDLAEPLEVAGPGFINIRIRAEFLKKLLPAMNADEHLGIAQPKHPQTVVVDYSGPNLAKEMHVGHLRSTIIGDALARVLEMLGHHVIRQNHVGDWGTQFGMLVAHLPVTVTDIRIPDLERYYVEAKHRFDTNPEFAAKARQIVAELHREGPKGNTLYRTQWEQFRQASLNHCFQVYARLGISFVPKDLRWKWQPQGLEQVPSDAAPPEESGIDGESFYNDDLPNVIVALDKAGLLSESQGAMCVFLDEFKGKDGEPLPVIVRKSDGGYLYATSDLAAIRYRAGQLAADRALYVTDSRQALHFAQVFSVARKAGFVGPEVSLEHVPFGTMMGADNKPFKTRTGGTVKLMDLLDEAETRAADLLREKNPELAADPRQLAGVAAAVGVGAVKYADLAHNRNSDYVFSWDKMLALDGNTAPYMQYAYARIRSIRKKAQQTDLDGASIPVEHSAERALAMKLAAFAETVDAVAAECLPHLLCNYLFELAGAFMGFYENCPVLQAESGALRRGRLALCDLTARTIRAGLGLLGIQTLEQM